MLTNLYAPQSRAHAVNTWIALATTKKLHLSMTDYYSKMCQYANNLAVTGAPLHDDELVVYILGGLDQDYNLVFIAVVARTDPISPSELYSQLLSFEQHVSLQAHQTSGSSSSAGTTDHITSDLDYLTMHDPYTGHDQVHAANERIRYGHNPYWYLHYSHHHSPPYPHQCPSCSLR
jgi:hypothetical protein